MADESNGKLAGAQNDRPTLKTIARLTGLSLSTVSLSLRDGSNLKQSTRDKVAKAAAQIGYVPNRAGVRLRTGRTNVLALVLAEGENTLDFTRQLIQGVGSCIQGGRYHLNVIPEFERAHPVAAVEYVLENKSADGLILTHTSARDARVQYLMEKDFAFVSHGRTEFYTAHAYHDFHAERFVQLAVERLARRQRKNILLAAVDNKTTNYSNTLGGFNRAIADAGLVGRVVQNAADIGTAAGARSLAAQLADELATDLVTNRADGLAAANHHAVDTGTANDAAGPAAGPRPRYDAIICNNELTALAIVGHFQSRDILLGRDYDLICKQTTEILPTLYPNIDTVEEDVYATGCELARLLLLRIAGTGAQDLQTLQEPITHWRSTV